MMSRFIAQDSDELIRRCAAKVAQRPRRQATKAQLRHGIPLFLGQLQRTLEAEELQHPVESLRISGAAGGQDSILSEMGAGATIHGKQLLDLGYTVDQVVHDYGDLCQAITDLAFERKAPFAISEFRTLNRCLDNAIASAVASFSAAREASLAAHTAKADAQHAALTHDLASSLATATYAVVAMELGNLPMSGSTGTVLKNSLAAMRSRIGGPTIDEIQGASDAGR